MVRYLMIALMLFVGGAIALSPAALVLLFREQPPISYGRREILNSQVPPGGTLKIAIASDIVKDCDAIVYRSIIDGNGTLFELAPEARPKKTNYTAEVPIPLGAFPGKAYYAPKIEWRCNFIQQFFPKIVIQRQLEFEIVPSEGQLPMPQQQGIYAMPAQKSELARAID